MRPTICEVCAEGRAAMDAGNQCYRISKIGPEGAASLAPALEKMPQLTSLDLGFTLLYDCIQKEIASLNLISEIKINSYYCKSITDDKLVSNNADIRYNFNLKEVRGFALGEASGAGGPGLWCVVLGTRLDAMWCGSGYDA